MKLFLAIRILFQVHELTMSHSVCIVKHLVLLQVQLQSLFVREIVQIFLNFNKILNALQRA